MKKENRYQIILLVSVFIAVVGSLGYVVVSKLANNSVSLPETTSVQTTTSVNPNTEDDTTADEVQTDKVVMFHNGVGPMCLEAVEFFKENNIDYIEYLTSDSNFSATLSEYKNYHGNVSEGSSTSFGYYPMIFVNGNAFSGFDETAKARIIEEINNL